MSRLDKIFQRLKTQGHTAFVAYVTAGDPDRARSATVLRALDGAGADILEVGVPFSDPMADGPAIQGASERALANGTTLTSTLEMIAELRPSVSAGIVVFSYANPILAMGLSSFMQKAAEAGVDGVLVLDLPIEESEGLRDEAAAVGIAPIFMLSPTTTDARLRRAAELGQGFLYAISRLGVTGERDTVADGAQAMVERIRQVTSLPIALGFGISRPEHVAEVGRWADAVVVGSALVSTVARAADSADLAGDVTRYVHWLKGESGSDLDP